MQEWRESETAKLRVGFFTVILSLKGAWNKFFGFWTNGSYVDSLQIQYTRSTILGTRNSEYHAISSNTRAYTVVGVHKILVFMLLVLSCIIRVVLQDFFLSFAWCISTPNNSTSILGTATSVAPVINLCVFYVERMQQTSKVATLAHLWYSPTEWLTPQLEQSTNASLLCSSLLCSCCLSTIVPSLGSK